MPGEAGENPFMHLFCTWYSNLCHVQSEYMYWEGVGGQNWEDNAAEITGTALSWTQCHGLLTSDTWLVKDGCLSVRYYQFPPQWEAVSFLSSNKLAAMVKFHFFLLCSLTFPITDNLDY